MGLNLGVFGFLPTTHTEANTKQMRSQTLHAAQLLTRDCLHTQTAVHAGNLRTTIILITKKPEDLQIEPHFWIKIAQGLVSLVYICGFK